MKTSFNYILFLLFLSINLSGCSTARKVLKGAPGERAGFIPNALELKENRSRSPFHGTWFQDMEYFYKRKAETNKIQILPVRTDFLAKKGWWSKLNTGNHDNYIKEVKKLAELLHSELVRNFKNQNPVHWEIAEEPDDKTLILEFAITEVVATKAHLNAVGTAAGFFVTGGGLISQTAGGSIAFEAKMFDGQNGELLLAFADRETDSISLISLKDFQYYAHARKTIKDWANQFTELTHSDPDKKVEDSSAITIIPW